MGEERLTCLAVVDFSWKDCVQIKYVAKLELRIDLSHFVLFHVIGESIHLYLEYRRELFESDEFAGILPSMRLRIVLVIPYELL